ncbi:MAG: peptidoglycan DD-metalloendopeptidase family protein [Candidatus Aminicenantaceae bacterium]
MNTRNTRFLARLLVIFLLVAFLFQACSQESVPKPYRPTYAHADYIHSLEQAGLAGSALAGDWIQASGECLNHPVAVTTPFEETFYVDPAGAFAVVYRFEIKRGQRTEIEIDLEGPNPVRVFMDLFRTEGDSSQYWVRVASANESDYRLEVEPRVTFEYAVRIQPELLRGGRFTVTIRTVPSLGFPVQGGRFRDIGSWFGDPRDGGRREHHGVDIFARRHSPVVAPSDAEVSRVREGAVGGRTVWLRDEERGFSMYFAHLQEQKVSARDRVKKGQVIGTVGNTGNARTTPPHLHFAIYYGRSGPVDPVDFLRETNDVPTAVTADLQILGQWVRARIGRTSLRTSPADRSTELVEVDPFTPMKVMAAAADHYRVLLPNGLSGYISPERIESTGESLQSQTADQPLPITASPESDSLEIGRIPSGAVVDILALFQDYWLVRTAEGLTGWTAASPPAPTGGRRLVPENPD